MFFKLTSKNTAVTHVIAATASYLCGHEGLEERVDWIPAQLRLYSN